MQDYSQPATTHKTPHKPVGFIYIVPLGLLVGFAVFVAVFVFKENGMSLSLPKFSLSGPTPTTFVIAEETKTPERIAQSVTPTPEVASSSAIAKKELVVLVLNGSGQAGVAGKMADLIKEAGYSNTKTGNSDAFTFTNVTLRYTKAAAGNIPELKKAVEAEYEVETSEEADLTGTTDVEVIVGK